MKKLTDAFSRNLFQQIIEEVIALRYSWLGFNIKLCLSTNDYQPELKVYEESSSIESYYMYSITSVARTLMARLPRLFRTRSWAPRKNPIAADLG